MAQSKALWNEKLSAIQIDLANTAPNVTELLYSSLYRASLTPVRHSLLEFFQRAQMRSLIEQCHWRNPRGLCWDKFILF